MKKYKLATELQVGDVVFESFRELETNLHCEGLYWITEIVTSPYTKQIAVFAINRHGNESIKVFADASDQEVIVLDTDTNLTWSDIRITKFVRTNPES